MARCGCGTAKIPNAVPLTVGVEGEEPSAITRVALSGDAHWVLSGGKMVSSGSGTGNNRRPRLKCGAR